MRLTIHADIHPDINNNTREHTFPNEGTDVNQVMSANINSNMHHNMNANTAANMSPTTTWSIKKSAHVVVKNVVRKTLNPLHVPAVWSVSKSISARQWSFSLKFMQVMLTIFA